MNNENSNNSKLALEIKNIPFSSLVKAFLLRNPDFVGLFRQKFNNGYFLCKMMFKTAHSSV